VKRLFIIVTMGACCAAAAVPASAAKPIKDLWATVNICDTSRWPDSMGIRGSMPGDGEHTRMYMRFTAQYYSPPKQAWLSVDSGVSPWRYVGSGDLARREGGWTFSLDPGYQYRGVVDFKWTKRGHVVRTAHVLTKGGHPGTTSADPKTYSQPLCDIT
jgi:hypothetical protein